jgi:ribosomal protein S18 acetylase RimI-like enzyme
MAESTSNVCGVRLYVHKNNHPAKRAYESLGMEKSRYELYEMPLERR